MREDNISWMPVDDEIIILDLQTSRYLALNGSAVLLWRALVDGTTEAALVELLVSTYAIDDAIAQRDVIAFLDSLAERHFLLDT
jgi:hypothetical protein